MLLLEFGVLTRRSGWSARDAALRLLPGALMMLALRAALTGVAWPWIALALAASFPAHLADLRRANVGRSDVARSDRAPNGAGAG